MICYESNTIFYTSYYELICIQSGVIHITDFGKKSKSIHDSKNKHSINTKMEFDYP